jgi:pilus assembly protein CpaE
LHASVEAGLVVCFRCLSGNALGLACRTRSKLALKQLLRRPHGIRAFQQQEQFVVRSKMRIIVTGSKGGVGTTTVALNLAVQLSMQTRSRVGLLDLARPFGQISLMLDLEPRFTILDALERIDRLDEALLASMAVRHKTAVEILAGPLHAPMKAEQRQSVTLAALTRLVETAGRAFDFAVIDMGVVNAAEWASVLSHADTLLLVAEPTVLALGMIGRHISAAAPAGVDCRRIQVVVNRCRQNDDAMLAAFEKESSLPILARLPNDYRQLTEALTMGMPLTGSSNNPLLSRYRVLASWIAIRCAAHTQQAPPTAPVHAAD